MTAAPETETDANGLTEAERKIVADGYRGPWDRIVPERMFQAVERIVAERVRVIEGERDAAREQGTRLADGLYRWRDDAERYLARAESAEAAHEAEKAALAALVQKWRGKREPFGGDLLADLDALLGGGEAR